MTAAPDQPQRNCPSVRRACYLGNPLIPRRSEKVSMVITRQRGSCPQLLWIASGIPKQGIMK